MRAPMLPSHGCSGDAGSDRAPADARQPSRAGTQELAAEALASGVNAVVPSCPACRPRIGRSSGGSCGTAARRGRQKDSEMPAKCGCGSAYGTAICGHWHRCRCVVSEPLALQHTLEDYAREFDRAHTGRLTHTAACPQSWSPAPPRPAPEMTTSGHDSAARTTWVARSQTCARTASKDRARCARGSSRHQRMVVNV
jgi:hypothetical protein